VPMVAACRVCGLLSASGVVMTGIVCNVVKGS
jgi:hypothetical protein